LLKIFFSAINIFVGRFTPRYKSKMPDKFDVAWIVSAIMFVLICISLVIVAGIGLVASFKTGQPLIFVGAIAGMIVPFLIYFCFFYALKDHSACTIGVQVQKELKDQQAKNLSQIAASLPTVQAAN
jgi:Mn2+/Fe2+ NRAMP family transporter